MTTEAAKFILHAYRPNGQDATDPQFAEALEQARQDPVLAEWFTAQRAFDAAAARALSEVKIPPQLRESILAGKKMARRNTMSGPPVWWAMAAAILMLLGLGGYWLAAPKAAPLASYLQAVSAVSDNMTDHIDLKTSDPAQVRDWLAGRHAETNYVLPAALQKEPIVGCRAMDWQGHQVSMICYLKGTNHMDLFVTELRGFSGAPPPGQLRLVPSGTQTAATWTSEGQLYVLVSHATGESLRQYAGKSCHMNIAFSGIKPTMATLTSDNTD